MSKYHDKMIDRFKAARQKLIDQLDELPEDPNEERVSALIRAITMFSERIEQYKYLRDKDNEQPED